MPRAKVHPDARKRVVQACRQCKTSKRKCNASTPCNHCIKRGIGDACEFLQEGNDRRRRPSSKSSIGSQQDSSEPNCPHPTQSPSLVQEHTRSSLVGNTPGQNSIFSPHTQRSDLPESFTEAGEARMLSNNEGEYVFVGRSASLSFLQFVREAVTRCIGPSEFSEHASRDHMLEVDFDLTIGADKDLHLNTQQRHFCVEHYFLATTGLVDVLSPVEARRLLDSQPRHNSYLAALRLLIIAIGKQAGPLDNSGHGAIEQHAFNQARLLMFTRMLEDPSLDMIRAFLLLAFYVLGACRRNAAFLYLGVAARAAHTLGLHTVESYSALDENRRHTQLKCWKSLVSLDLIVSSILGRTTAVLSHRRTGNTIVNITGGIDDHPNIELEAAYRLALIVDSISSQFNGSEPITSDMAQSHLKSLNSWSNLLPVRLRPSTLPKDHTTKTRQSLIGCMHISSFYYFAVMLVTRPFLVMNIARRLSLSKERTYARFSKDSSDIDELASACLNAATFMAQTCCDLLELKLLEENMCILKAWVFAAGLVLGFELFASFGNSSSVEQAFFSCRRVLEKLSKRSPQALQYYEVLCLFSAAIDKHKQLQKSKKPGNAASLVARIMDLNSHDGVSNTVARSSISTNAAIELQQPSALHDSFGNLTQDFAPGTNNFGEGLEDFSIPTPESFMFDLQTFGMMPWSLS